MLSLLDCKIYKLAIRNLTKVDCFVVRSAFIKTGKIFVSQKTKYYFYIHKVISIICVLHTISLKFNCSHVKISTIDTSFTSLFLSANTYFIVDKIYISFRAYTCSQKEHTSIIAHYDYSFQQFFENLLNYFLDLASVIQSTCCTPASNKTCTQDINVLPVVTTSSTNNIL